MRKTISKSFVSILVAGFVFTVWTPTPAAAACAAAFRPDQEIQLMRESGGVIFNGLVKQRWGHTSLVEVREVWQGTVPTRLVTVSNCSHIECSGGDSTPGGSYLFYGLDGGPFYTLLPCTSPTEVNPDITLLLGASTPPPESSVLDLAVVAGFVFHALWWAIAFLALVLVAVLWIRSVLNGPYLRKRLG